MLFVLMRASSRYSVPTRSGCGICINTSYFAGLGINILASKALIVREVSTAIVEEYGDEVVRCPTSPQEWKAGAQGFEDRWNSPHAICALDDKHVAIKCPEDSGSIFYKYMYKGFYFIVLMALVGAKYDFCFG